MSTPTTRHLRPVPDDPADVPTDLMWEASETENARYTHLAEDLRTAASDDDGQEAPAGEPLPPLQGRVYDSPENDSGALTPAKANLADVNDTLKDALADGNTYDLLACTRTRK